MLNFDNIQKYQPLFCGQVPFFAKRLGEKLFFLLILSILHFYLPLKRGSKTMVQSTFWVFLARKLLFIPFGNIHKKNNLLSLLKGP